MPDQPTTFTVQWIKEETPGSRIISLKPERPWAFITGQVAILAMPGVGESYFTMASAPEDKAGMEFLIADGKGVAQALWTLKKGDQLQGKGPVGRGFPIDNYRGRDMILAAVGSAISPLRSVLRSIGLRRKQFGKVTLVYGERHPEDFAFLKEIPDWRKSDIEVVQIVSRPEGTGWTGKTGHVQTHFADAIARLSRPVALICGMKAMMQESKTELLRLGIPEAEILSNF